MNINIDKCEIHSLKFGNEDITNDKKTLDLIFINGKAVPEVITDS